MVLAWAENFSRRLGEIWAEWPVFGEKDHESERLGRQRMLSAGVISNKNSNNHRGGTGLLRGVG
jgi:hypothetical protein